MLEAGNQPGPRGRGWVSPPAPGSAGSLRWLQAIPGHGSATFTERRCQHLVPGQPRTNSPPPPAAEGSRRSPSGAARAGKGTRSRAGRESQHQNALPYGSHGQQALCTHVWLFPRQLLTPLLYFSPVGQGMEVQRHSRGAEPWHRHGDVLLAEPLLPSHVRGHCWLLWPPCSRLVPWAPEIQIPATQKHPGTVAAACEWHRDGTAAGLHALTQFGMGHDKGITGWEEGVMEDLCDFFIFLE